LSEFVYIIYFMYIEILWAEEKFYYVAISPVVQRRQSLSCRRAPLYRPLSICNLCDEIRNIVKFLLCSKDFNIHKIYDIYELWQLFSKLLAIIQKVTHQVSMLIPYGQLMSSLLIFRYNMSHGTMKSTLKAHFYYFVFMAWLLHYLYSLHPDFYTLENIINIET
jgi:hypothetical protein